jgi:hypothetical protein
MGKRVGVILQHPEVWDEFRRFVISKWGKKHTAMALELENAIRFYLEHAHTQIEEPPKSRTLKTIKAISEKLSEYREITDQDVEDVIVKTVGGDERTVSKYTYLLQKLRVIEPSRRVAGSDRWIYTVNPLEIQQLDRIYGLKQL